MSWKRNTMEAAVWLSSQIAPPYKKRAVKKESIFVLRNNDIGDLLVITPLFEALKRRFPEAQIVAGVGQWNLEILKYNPYISEVLPVNAPWHNKFIPAQTLWDALNYIAFSDESQELARRHFDIGIDILGSSLGSLLMIRAGIPYRLGVRGYAGGYSAVQQYVEFNEYEHVGRSALRFAELLGATDLPECRPQIFLSSSERESGEYHWSLRQKGLDQRPKRIVIGPGGGFAEKCWPLENYTALVKLLSALGNLEIILVGGRQDREAGQQLAAASQLAKDLTGKLTIRETFALVAAADFVVCNSSMLMHTAAAFSIPNVVLLGECFTSTLQHTAQWGYDKTCYIFGKDNDRTKIYTPNEVMTIIQKFFWSEIE